MNIALVINKISQVYIFRKDLIEALNKEHKVYIFSVNDNDEYKKKLEEMGCEIRELLLSNHSKNPLSDIKGMFDLIKKYKRYDINYSLNFTIKPNIYGTLACKIAKIKAINNITGLGYAFLDTGITNRIIKILYKISFKYPQKVFFQNYDDMNLFLENKLVKKEICDRLPGSGINLMEYKFLEKNKINDKIVFLFIGRISYEKGAEIYIEAAKLIKKEYKNIEFQMIGGIQKENKSSLSLKMLEKYEKQGVIKYLGVTNTIKENIRNSDCIILPTYYREGVPRSLIESAAMAKPIITTKNVGCKDIVSDGYNGFLAEVKSVESLVEKIEKFLKLNSEERKKMGKNGRSKVEKEFDVNIILGKYLKELGDVL
ncbi:glycosyltransferase family 4 protein [Fusobacteria bacterium ZRK30]|nr:glycosyltransferase family 4 protein [Fusobacteria bacterium ZRK30]